jgi:hypothetical protein
MSHWSLVVFCQNYLVPLPVLFSLFVLLLMSLSVIGLGCSMSHWSLVVFCQNCHVLPLICTNRCLIMHGIKYIFYISI